MAAAAAAPAEQGREGPRRRSGARAPGDGSEVIVAPVCYAIEQPTPQLALLAARCFHGEWGGLMPQNWVWGRWAGEAAPPAAAGREVEDDASTRNGNRYHYHRSGGSELQIQSGGYPGRRRSAGEDALGGDGLELEFLRAILSGMDAEGGRGDGRAASNLPCEDAEREHSGNGSIGGAAADSALPPSPPPARAGDQRGTPRKRRAAPCAARAEKRARAMPRAAEDAIAS